MLLLGAAESTLDVGANTLLVWVHGNRVGPAMNALHSFFGIGALVAPVIVATVVSLRHNAVDAYLLLALMLLPVAAWLLRLPSPVGHAAAKSQTTTGGNRRLVFLIAMFLFLYVGAEVGFGGWIFTYTVELKLSAARTAAYLTSMFFGALTIGRLFAIPLATRFRHSTILITDLVGCLLSITFIIVFSHSFLAILAGTFGVGLFMASIFPTVLSFAGHHLKVTGQVTGRFIVGASAGAMTVPLLIGQVFESVGPAVVMYVVLSALLLASAILAHLLRRTVPYESNDSDVMWQGLNIQNPGEGLNS
jgi:fucose permease